LAGLVLSLLLHVDLQFAAVDEAEQRAQLNLVRERIARLQTRMRSIEDERNSLAEELRDAEQKIGKVAMRLRELNGKLGRRRRNLETLRKRESQQQAAFSDQRQQLARQLLAAYAMGRQERLKLLLNQQEPARISRMLTYYDYFNRARVMRLREIEKVLRELRATQAQIVRDEGRLRRLQAAELAERDDLQQQQAQRRQVLNKLAAELQQQGDEIGRLQQNEKRLSKLLSEIEQALADVPDIIPADRRFEQRRGRMSWPTKGWIARAFGSPRLGGLRWDGVIIEAPEGQEVKAVHRGRVAYADWLRGFGLLLIIDHGDGWMSLYGHNQSLFREAGDWVESDEPVASLGVSGGRTTPAIYFGIRHAGRPVDPLRWCQRPQGRKVG
jgi:septal ring factor EnvC (AmiA/AmiB activator)